MAAKTKGLLHDLSHQNGQDRARLIEQSFTFFTEYQVYIL